MDTAGNLSAVTSPVLPSVPVAAFSVPFKASQPACSPASSLPVPLAGTQQFVLQVRGGGGGGGGGGCSRALPGNCFATAATRSPPPPTHHPPTRSLAVVESRLPAAALCLRPVQVMIFPNDTIYNPGSGLEPGEVLAGNVKSTLTVTGWWVLRGSKQPEARGVGRGGVAGCEARQ